MLVGLSGGPDSVALLDSLLRLKDELGIRVEAAHLNHMLRGDEADEDQRWARELAECLGVPFHSARIDVRKLAKRRGCSEEHAGRLARYWFFASVCLRTGCNKVALGHTKDDSVETVVMRFLKGTGLTGLAGIPPVRRGWIVRPLINLDRGEIERYCRSRGLEPRIDRSNYDVRYFRNKVRAEVLPFLERVNPRFRDAVARMARLCRWDADFMDGLARRKASLVCVEGDGARVELKRVLRLHPALRNRVLRIALRRAAPEAAHRLTFDHVASVASLIEKGVAGQRVCLPGDVVAELQRGYLKIYRQRRRDKGEMRRGPTLESGVTTVQVPGTTYIPEFGITLEARLEESAGFEDGLPSRWAARAVPLRGHTKDRWSAFLDADTVRFPIQVRSRRAGDRFAPLGLGGSKKLKDYMISQKIPREARDGIPIVVDSAGRIIWVAGFQIDDRNKITALTKRVLALRVVGGSRSIEIGQAK